MKSIAIIPAGGGSKRLARKNILPLGGIPLLDRVVQTCLQSGLFDQVIVSSEDHEIQEVAINAGALVYKRNLDLAQDRSTVVAVCLDVLQHYHCENFCCIYATAALLTPLTLQQSAESFLNRNDIQVLMGVSKYNYSPVQALSINESGCAEILFPQYLNIQSQFYPKARVSNGTFYWARADDFANEKTFYSHHLGVFDVPDNEVCDLDTAEDYEILKRKFKLNET